MGNGRQMKYRVFFLRGVVAGVVSEGPFGSKLARRDVSLENVLSVCRYIQVHGLAPDHLDRLASWRVTGNIEPGRDIVFAEGPIDDLDHATEFAKYGGKMGIDATAKGAADGRKREWPPEIVMSEEIRRLVDEKWGDYGI